MLKKILVALACTAGLAITTASANAKELAFGTFVPAASPTVTKIFQPWIEWFNSQASEHDVTMKLFAGGTLGRNPRAQEDLVRDGVADLTLTVPAYKPGVYPDYDIFELPGIASNVREATLAAVELAAEGKLSGYEDFHVVATYTSGPYMLHTKEPIGGYADIADKRIRVAGQIQTAVVEAIGAVPQNMSALEMAENIDRGLIDGAMTDASVAKTFRVADVAKNHFATELGVLPFLIVMNKDAYAALPDQVKEILAKTPSFIAEKQIEHYGAAIDGNMAAWKDASDHTVVMQSDEDASKIAEASKPVIDKVSAAATAGLVDAYRAKVEEIRNR